MGLAKLGEQSACTWKMTVPHSMAEALHLPSLLPACPPACPPAPPAHPPTHPPTLSSLSGLILSMCTQAGNQLG